MSGDGLTSSTYTIKDGYISKIEAGTDVAKLKQNIHSSNNIVIKGKDGNVVGSGLVGTGMTITVGNNTYTLVITGDTSGDRKMRNIRLITNKTTLYRE